MKVAVTGATGFLGGAIVRRLAAQGHVVLALGRTIAAPEGVEYARWDLGVEGPPPAGIQECDAVVHAAAHVAAWGDEQVFQGVTVMGTARVIDAMDPRARLVVIGSSSIYVPDGREGAYRESDAPLGLRRYRGPYPRAKADQERLVEARRPDAIILRPRAVWGPGDRTLLPRIESRVRSGRLVLPGGGRNRMSTTHIESLADAVDAAISHPDVRGPVNVADATPHTPRDLLVALFSARNEPLQVVGVPVRLADGVAFALEWAYRLAGSRREPPITRYAISAVAASIVLDLGRLHDELRVVPDIDLALKAGQLAGTELNAR